MSDEAPVRKQRTYLRDIVEILLIALILYVIIWNAFQTVRVDGTSMIPTLQNDDLLLASKISYFFGKPERGDIVVLIPPGLPDKDFIKRVIGVPGDVLEIEAGNPSADPPIPARILIKPGGSGNFQELAESYLPELWTAGPSCCVPVGDPAGRVAGTHTDAATAVTIPADQYFVMGDNRNHSEDSRWFGFVARKNIMAKAFLRLWPFGHFGLGPGNTLVPVAAAVPVWVSRRRRRLRRAATES